MLPCMQCFKRSQNFHSYNVLSNVKTENFGSFTTLLVYIRAVEPGYTKFIHFKIRLVSPNNKK